MISPLGGHVGDGEPIFTFGNIPDSLTTSSGNFHCFILYKNEEEFAKVQAVVDAMIHKAIALDGTCASKSSPFIQFVLRVTSSLSIRHG